jgi:transposase
MGKPETPAAVQKLILDLYSTGLNTVEVARKTGVHNSTVLRILHRNSIEVRDKKPRHLTLPERFWLKVQKGEKADDCWKWNGCKYGMGYGQLSHVSGGKKRSAPAHKLSYRIHHGEFDESLLVCHRCDNPECCNPRHLFLGTAKDNIQDKYSKGRGADVRGERNPVSRLTEDQIILIRELRANNESISELAEKFNVSNSQIKRIVSRELWGHIQ